MTEPTWRLEVHDELPSTQDAAVERARAGEPGGLAILARRQTAGRGSRGRGWTAPRGNLNLSVLLHPRTPASAAGLWALLAGLALLDAIHASAPTAPLRLKWPNDLLLQTADGIWAKLAGILIDSAANADATLDWLVIGIGANLRAAPTLEARPTASLAEAGIDMNPEPLARAIVDAITRLEAIWQREGEPAVIDAWQRHAHPIGTTLRVTIGATTHEGRFDGLAPGGALRLRTTDGVRSIATGEVFLVRGPAQNPAQ